MIFSLFFYLSSMNIAKFIFLNTIRFFFRMSLQLFCIQKDMQIGKNYKISMNV
jgi:hypothetical protein